MALDPVPWMVSNAKHSADIGRNVAYAATNGANGVIRVSDLKVTALPVPGASVRVLPGAAAMLNRYPGAIGQSYVMRNATSTDVAIPATGSSGGATRYIIARVRDPQYNDPAPADVQLGPYTFLEYVGSINNLQYPHVVLAKIVQPANTATITNAMITDMREVANPRIITVERPNATVASEAEGLRATGPNGEWFPNGGGEQSIDIPEWATRMQIRADWISMRMAAGNAAGKLWVEWGPYSAPSTRQYKTQEFRWDSSGVNNVQRIGFAVVDDLYIPAEFRGTTQLFVLKGRHETGTGGSLSVDGGSGTSLSVRFLEVADRSTS